MDTFRYKMPVELFFGENCIEENGDIFRKMGSSAAVITYALPEGLRHYALEDVEKVLTSQGISYCINMDVQENAPIASIEALCNKIRRITPDFIVAIGGGSVIDSAKIACLYLKNSHMTIDDVIAARDLESLPLVAVPTTTGTGSECTCWTAVTKRDNSIKVNIATPVFAKYAFDDPRYVLDMPAGLTRSVTLDAIAHCIESYMNKGSNPICMSCAEAGMRLFAEFKEALALDKYQIEDRENMLLMSSLGGMAITVARCSVPHGLSFPVCHALNIPHGLACAVTLVPFLKRFQGYERLDQVLSFCRFADLADMEEYFQNILKKDLGDAKVDEADFERWAADCYGKHKWRFETGTVHRFTMEDAKKMYQEGFDFT